MKLYEVLNRTLPYTWKENTETRKEATFTAPNGIEYSVQFTPFGSYTPKNRSIPVWTVVFNVAATSEDRMTGTGNQFDVMSTVTKIVNDAITNGIEGLHIAAKQNEVSRVALYERLVRMCMAKHNWMIYEEGQFESMYEWTIGAKE